MHVDVNAYPSISVVQDALINADRGPKVSQRTVSNRHAVRGMPFSDPRQEESTVHLPFWVYPSQNHHKGAELSF